MGELELIEYIRGLAAEGAPAWLEVGIGDDAAVLRVGAGERVLATTDMVVEGTHFESGTPPEAVGRKAVARALSDLAAMAARPLCVVAAVQFRAETDPGFCRRLGRALWEASRELSAPLVGGDVVGGAGPLSLTVTAIGLPGPAGVVRRTGARPGDLVCVTGALGGAMRGRHLSFTPCVAEALWLAERFDLHAMIDVSDGLSTDLLHLARASGLGLTVRADCIPVHPDVVALGGEGAEGDERVRHALNDGEDYELVFCLSEPEAKEAARSGVLGTAVSIIGTARRGSRSFVVWPDGRREQLRGEGWQHLVA